MADWCGGISWGGGTRNSEPTRWRAHRALDLPGRERIGFTAKEVTV